MYLYLVEWWDSRSSFDWQLPGQQKVAFCRTLTFSETQRDITCVDGVSLTPTVSNTGFVLGEIVVPPSAIVRIVRLSEADDSNSGS